MGMFDWYAPSPLPACPRCGAALDDFQSKDGPCGSFVWQQGARDPVEQRVDDEWRAPAPPPPLPARFHMYTTCACGCWVDAVGDAPDGTWVRTTVVSAPVPPRRGRNGRWSCPCCGCFTLEEEPPGTFAICEVCWWEDDHAQYRNPELTGGANVPCLRQARAEYLFRGAADPDVRHRVRPPRADEVE
jgi:hypothetical protein